MTTISSNFVEEHELVRNIRNGKSKVERISAPKCLSNLPNILAKPDGNYRMLRTGTRRHIEGDDQITAIAANIIPAMIAVLS